MSTISTFLQLGPDATVLNMRDVTMFGFVAFSLNSMYSFINSLVSANNSLADNLLELHEEINVILDYMEQIFSASTPMHILNGITENDMAMRYEAFKTLYIYLKEIHLRLLDLGDNVDEMGRMIPNDLKELYDIDVCRVQGIIENMSPYLYRIKIACEVIHNNELRNLLDFIGFALLRN